MALLTTRRSFPAWIAASSAIAVHAQQSSRGSFGFVAKVDADGMLSPTLKTVVVQSVLPNMPAALAGVAVGDSIVEVEGVKVAGAKASTMADRMKRRPGETVVLKLLRSNGETYVVKLTAVALQSQ
jgi:C-terminal processing protease CtpA/Prc